MSKAIKRGKSWQVRVYDYTDDAGKQHNRSFTAPTKAEAEYLASEFKRSKRNRKHIGSEMTVGDAVDRYVELKALLSPTTLTAYRKVRKFAFPELMETRITRLSDEVIQQAINKEVLRIGQKGRPLSPKTVKNEYAVVSGALKEVCHLQFYVTLPKVQRHIIDIPEVEEVMKAIIGSDIELPCLLALWLSFSMSEIRGLMCSDIKDGYITINRVKVETDQGQVVKNTAKVETRLRKHKIPPYIMQLINDTSAYQKWLKSAENGFLVPTNRKSIYVRWKTICKEHNLGDLSFHKLRHLNCSVMASLGISEKVMLERGGWKTSYVPKSVYTHTFTSDREQADALIDSYFADFLKNAQEKTYT